MNTETQKLIADWMVAIGTILLAVVTVFQDKIRTWIQRPKLILSIEGHVKSPMRTSISSSEGGEKIMVAAFVFNMMVRNKGNHRAEEVEVFVSELQKEQADGTYCKINSFPSANLRWSDSKEVFSKAISPGMQRHCTLCAIVKPSERANAFYWNSQDLIVAQEKTILGFHLARKPYSKSHLVGPGKYRLSLHVAAANVKPVAATIEFNHSGQWFDQENEMFSQGLGIKII